MKRAAILLVVFVYAFSCAGIFFEFHLCQGKVVSVSIQQSHQEHNCCEKPMDKDCCQDVAKIVKLEQAGMKYMQAKLSALTSVSLPVILFPSVETAFLSKAAVPPDLHPPPLWSSLPRHLALGVILV